MAAISFLLAFIAALTGALYLLVKYKHGYWARRGIKHDKPNLFFGNLRGLFTQKQNIFEFLHEQYFKYPNEKVVGFYGFSTPMMIIRDLDIVKDICIKDFSCFTNRSFHPDKQGDPLGSELMFGKWDDAWRGMRKKMAFAFTTGRMKKMYPCVSKVGDHLNQLCADTAQKGEAKVNIQQFSTRYAVDVITSSSFGSEGQAISSPDKSVMFKVLNNIFNFNFREGFSSNLLFLQKRGIYGFLSRLGLGFKIFRKQIEDDIYRVVDIAVKKRMQSEERRDDIFDEIVFSKAPEFQGLQKKAGAAFQMLVAGTETTATTILFTLYALARHPEIQRKLQKEIRDNLKKHNGEIPYEVLNNMEYLDQVFHESLRLFPVLPFLDRIATKDYRIAGTDIVIEKGTAVFIPAWATQKDPHYFPDPEEFRPQRFAKENKDSFPPMAYLPFGTGPRNCIGERFGRMVVKSFLVSFFKDFDVSLTEESRKPLEWNKNTFLLSLERGLPLSITPSKH